MQYDLGHNYKVGFLAIHIYRRGYFFSSVGISTSGEVNGQLSSWALNSGSSIQKKFMFWGRIVITFSSLNLIKKRKS